MAGSGGDTHSEKAPVDAGWLRTACSRPVLPWSAGLLLFLVGLVPFGYEMIALHPPPRISLPGSLLYICGGGWIASQFDQAMQAARGGAG